eukprot:5049240-Alexandrium_andersonii.AAC.1
MVARILELAERHIKRRTAAAAQHPWMNEECLELVAAKCAAVGAPIFPEAALRCSRGLAAAHRS